MLGALLPSPCATINDCGAQRADSFARCPITTERVTARQWMPPTGAPCGPSVGAPVPLGASVAPWGGNREPSLVPRVPGIAVPRLSLSGAGGGVLDAGVLGVCGSVTLASLGALGADEGAVPLAGVMGGALS